MAKFGRVSDNGVVIPSKWWEVPAIRFGSALMSERFPRPFLTAGLFGIFKKTLLPTLGAAVKRQCPTSCFLEIWIHPL